MRSTVLAAAATVVVGTAVLTSRHASSLQPHAEHLPERFGLFTLILLGESIVDAVVALSKYGGLDIDARPKNESGNVDADGDDVNAVKAFLDRVVPNTKPSSSTMCVLKSTVRCSASSVSRW